MAFGCTITVNAGKAPSAQSNFVWLATAANFPLAAKDGGANSILNGGGNLRCYTDSTKATRLPIDVVSFVTGGSPVIQVWGLSPSLNVSSTVYVEADEVETTQPAATNVYGRNAVYGADGYAFSFDSDPTVSIPNATGGANGVSSGMSAGNLVLGKIDSAYSFNGSTTSVDVARDVTTDWGLNDFTVSAWINVDAGIGTSNGRIANTSGKGGAPGKTGWQLKIKGNNNSWSFFDCSIVSGSDSIGSLAVFNSTHPLGVWQHVVMRYERVTKKLELFVDGALAESITGDTVLGSITSPNDLIVGASKYFQNSSNPIDQVFNGLIDSSVGTPTFKNNDYIAAEYNNQNDPTSFWSTSAWQDSAGGGTTGAISQALQGFSQSLSGNVVNSYTGSISQVTQAFAQSSSGSVTSASTTGAITQAANSFTQSATGSTVTNITGVISQSMGAFTQSLSATVVENITGAITQTISSFTQSSIGTVAEQITGSTSQTITGFTMSATGKIPVSWTDKASAVASWSNQAKVTTTWSDR